MKNRGLTIFLIIIVILGIIGGSFISTRNKLVDMDEEINIKWAQVENQLKRRADLIPNLLETVKGYASHEKEVIQSISDARAGYSSANTPKEYAEAESKLNEAMMNLNVILENYPDLKANQNFQDFQVELSGTENRIATERMRYNEAVGEYNRAIRKFPTSITASLFNFDERDYFEIDEKDGEVPKVEF